MAGKRRADAVAPSGAGATASSRIRLPAFLRRGDGSGSGEPKPTWKRRILKTLKWATVTGVVLALLGVAGFVYLYKTTDIPEPNSEFLTQATFVYYEGGEDELGRFATQLRDSIPLSEMPDNIKDAVVAAEDRSFYTNSGIDPKGILRAVFNNAKGGSTQGASTITQQYVKILYLSQEQSYKRKVKEAILSLKIQREYSKDEVLEGYLNTIYFGRGAYGIEAAANVWFKKKAADLELREAAVLASVLNDPNDLDPDNGKDARRALKGRYDFVLASMAETGKITDAEAEQAKKRLPPFPDIAVESTYGDQKGHMLTLVKNELLGLRKNDGSGFFTEEEIDGGGLRITTTLTDRAMKAAELGVTEVKPDFKGADKLHVAAATVEPGTGALRGFYAGQDYLESQINWAVAGGQAGSTFKPFALAAGLQDGYALSDVFDGNSPYELPDGTDVENQGDSDYGSAVSLTQATQDSINTAYIDLTLAMDDGPDKIIATAEAMGIPPKKARKNSFGIPDSSLGLEPITGVALGSQTVSPINMANGYATVAAEGLAAEVYVIDEVTDADGKVLYRHKVVDERALSPEIASDVSYALQQVVEGGSGLEAQMDDGRPTAGKTGTATKEGGAVSSSWFVGFTPQLSTAVMYVRGTGNGQLDDGWIPPSEDGREGYFGGNYPAKTWNAIMARDLEGVPIVDFPDPAFVDGEAPKDGYEPYTPPPAPQPTREPTREPSSEPPSQEPTTVEPTIEEPTEEPTTEEPTEEPTTEEPTEEPTCPLLGCGPTEEPTEQPTDPPSEPTPSATPRPAGREPNPE